MPDRYAMHGIRHILFGVDHLLFVLGLLLIAVEVPRCRLGPGEDGPRLGWNTWMRSDEFTHDVADAVFRVEDV